MVKYIKVEVKKNTVLKFPPSCIVCHQSCGKETAELKGIYTSYHGELKSIFLGFPKIEVPAHKQCMMSLNKKGKFNELILLIMLLLIIIFFEYTKKPTFSLLYFFFVLLAALLCRLIIEFFDKAVPVIFHEYTDRFSLYFLEKKYSQEFLELNKDRLYKRKTLGDYITEGKKNIEK